MKTHKWKIFKLTFEGVVALFAIAIMFISFNLHIPNHYIISIILFLLATFLVFFLEVQNFKNYKQILSLDFTMDFLITIAIHISYLYSLVMTIIKMTEGGIKNIDMEFWEVSYMLSFFIRIGHLIEDKLKIKTSLGIKDLLKLQNKNVQILQDNKYVDIKSNKIQIGDVVKINKGSSIPTDGVLISKHAYLDYSSLLGESIPRKIKKGEMVLSGSINVDDFIIYKATKTTKDSTLLKIISQLENIVSQKSNIERTSEKIVKYFLPTILSISLITFIIWVVIGYSNLEIPKIFISYNNPWTNAIYHAISTLVIACPCAFGIAAPAAIYSSSGIASKNKIIFSSAKIYEMVNKIKYIAFDKTGTITKGQPTVVEFQSNNKKYNKIIFEIANHSTHPLSLAIKNYLTNYIEKDSFISFEEIKEKPGIGMFATYQKNDYFLGSIKFAKANHFKLNSKLKIDDDITTIFAINNEIVATFKIDDPIKEDAEITIKKFNKIGIKTIILSGDKNSKVKKVSEKLGIDYWYGELLPDDKARIIKQFISKGEKIIFVGDGINDILAIKTATIGMAYASGSEITNSIADISLIENDLNLAYKAITLAKRTLKLVKLNFIWAFIFNLLCIPLAILGLIPPWLGAILMISSTTILLTNTLVGQARNKKVINY